MQMLPPWMLPSVSLTMIALPLFGVLVASFELCILTKRNDFTLQSSPGYTVSTAYFTNVFYDPFLHDNHPNCVPANINFLSIASVTQRAVPLPPRPYTPP